MHSSPVPIGKRPEFKQSRSAGWSWPRLVPIHEQQSRSSQASQSPAPHSLRDHSEQEEPPTTIISSIMSKLHTEPDAPLSPVGGGSVAETVQHQPYEHSRDSLSSRPGSGEERRAVGSDSVSIEDLAKKKGLGSELGSAEDPVEMSDSGPESGPIIDQQSDTELPVDNENTSKYLPTKYDALSASADQSIITNSHSSLAPGGKACNTPYDTDTACYGQNLWSVQLDPVLCDPKNHGP